MDTTPASSSDPTRTSELKAFEVLVKLTHRRLLAYAVSMARRTEVAEDLVQEAVVTAWRRLGTFDTSKDFGAWVRGIIRMKYKEWARSRREEPLDDGVLESLSRVHDRWERAVEEGKADAFAALRGCLDRLAGALKETVDLFYLSRLSCAVVAERTGASETTVRKRLQRGRDDLARCVRRKLASPDPQGGER